MEMWETHDLSGADKVKLMSAAHRIPITGFTSNVAVMSRPTPPYSQACVKAWQACRDFFPQNVFIHFFSATNGLFCWGRSPYQCLITPYMQSDFNENEIYKVIVS